ncbi:MAG: SdpI family protein [Propionibacteriaceae bacterium]|nr:SdpI family protein [Propionibacteriaceae bacterium]
MTEQDFKAWTIIGFAATTFIWLAAAVTFGVGRRSTDTRNRWAGIRTKAAMHSPEAWAAAHKAAMTHIWVMGVGILPVGVIMLFFISSEPMMAGIIEMALLVACATWIVIAMVMGNNAAKAVAQEKVVYDD